MTREEAMASLAKKREEDKKSIRDTIASNSKIYDIIRVTEDDGTVVDYEIVGDTTMRGTRLGIRNADGVGPSYGLEVDSGLPAHGMVAGGQIIPRSQWDAEQKAKTTQITQPVTTTPAAGVAGTTASVPVMITRKMEADLLSRGLTQEQINAMTPQEANDMLAQPAPTAAPVEPVVPVAGVVEPAAAVTPIETVAPTEPASAEPVPAGTKEEQDLRAAQERVKKAQEVVDKVRDLPEDSPELMVAYTERTESRSNLIRAEVAVRHPNSKNISREERAFLAPLQELAPLRPDEEPLTEGKKWRKGEEVGYNDNVGKITKAIPPEGQSNVLYRAVTKEDYERILATGQIDSDMRGAITPDEGINLTPKTATAAYYLSRGETGVILAIDTTGLDLNFIQSDSYVRSFNPISADKIVGRSDFIHKDSETGDYLLRPQDNTPVVNDPPSIVNYTKAYPTPTAVEPTPVTPTPVTPEVPTAVEPPDLAPLRRVVKAEQTEEDVSGLVGQGLVELYNGQPVITQAGLETLPEAERPRLNPEARKIQIDTRTSEAAAEAISKNLRIGVDQVPFDVRMPAGWTLVGDIYIPPTVEVAPEAAARPNVTPEESAVLQKPTGSPFQNPEEFRAAFNLRGQGHARFAIRLDLMQEDGAITEDGKNLILATIWDNNTNDGFLANMEMGSARKNVKSYGYGGRSRQTVEGGRVEQKPLLELIRATRRGGTEADKRTALTLNTFWHEFGHAGYYSLLDAKQKKAVNDAFGKTTRAGRRAFFAEGKADMENTPWFSKYYAKNESEWFAQSFAEYVITQKSDQKGLVPVFEQLLNKIKSVFTKLFNRKEQVNLNDIFEFILRGEAYGQKPTWQGYTMSTKPAVYGTPRGQAISPEFTKRALEREQPTTFADERRQQIIDGISLKFKRSKNEYGNNEFKVEYDFGGRSPIVDKISFSLEQFEDSIVAMSYLPSKGGKYANIKLVELEQEFKGRAAAERAIKKAIAEIEMDERVGGAEEAAPEARESRRAITPQQDRDYLDAVERGDLDTASRVVENTASRAGFTSPTVFHGSIAKGVTRFDVGQAVEVEGGVFFTTNEDVAAQYTFERAYGDIISDEPLGNVTAAKLRMDKPLEYQARGKIVDAVEMQRVINKAKADGFDGVIIRNIDDSIGMTGDMGDVYIVFNGNQIKSSDPVTYDDAGNIIPPSQRFQQGEADIRYARREQQLANSLDSGDFSSAQALVDGGATMDRATFLRSITPSATQRATTIHTRLERDGIISKDEFANEQGLVYGDGRGAASSYLGSQSYEPFPPNGFTPDYSGDRVAGQGAPIDKKFRTILNTFVLNVVDPQTRSFIVKDIANLLENGGRAVFVTRGKDVANSQALVSFGPLERIQRSEGKLTYQRGFTQPELIQYLQETLGNGFEVRALRGGSASDVRVEVVKNTDATLENAPLVPETRERRRATQPTVGMTTDGVRARLEALGFGVEGMIRIVEDPQATFEGRTIIQDGKAVRIELNASALRDNAAIDRVLNHEFAEAANADGALNKLVERLTPKEKKEINEAITRLGYEEGVRTTEEAARAIEALAAGWKGRGFFERAVARVEAWSSKLGLKLTRRAAEYIAARNLAEVSDTVRKWHISDALANLNGARRVTFNGMSAVLIPPSEMQVAYSIAAYHGTPHEIKGGFQLEKIGTGEGEQAFGWGLYFAEKRGIAEGYRERLSRGGVDIKKVEEERRAALESWEKFKTERPDQAQDFREEVATFANMSLTEEDVAIELQNTIDGYRNFDTSIDGAEKARKVEVFRPDATGSVYTVEIDIDPDEILDWDKPVTEQDAGVIQKLKEAGIYSEETPYGNKATGEYIYHSEDTSKILKSIRLKEAGIKGIRYLDRGSRYAQPKKTGFGWMVDDYRGTNYFKTRQEAEEFAAKGQTYNFVVFDENLIKITARNGEQVEIRESRREPAPTFTEESPEAKTLSNLKASMEKVDGASETKGGKPETQKVSEIAANWMESGGDERALQDAIIENTNLSPVNAAKVAKVIARQYDIQQSIATAFLETQTGLSVEALPEGVTLPKEVDPDRPKPVMSRLFEVFMGVRVPPVKITVNEKTALKDQIRLKAAANRAAKEAQKETAAAVVDIIKQMELRGPVRQKQAQALAKRAAKVIWTSEKSLEAFTDYAARVVENTNYDADLREAKAAQARAKQLSKQKSVAMSPQRRVLEDISKVAVNSIDDPRIFAESVNYYLRGFKKVTSPDYVVIPDSEMTSYLSELETQEINSFAERERLTNERLAEQYGIPISEVESLLNSQDIIRDLAAFAKREKVESILNQKVSDVQTVLGGYDQAQLRGDQRKLVDALMSVDTNSLDAKEKQTLIRIGNNVIYNNQTNGAQYFVAVANGQQNARQAAKDTKTIEKNRAWVDLLPTLGSKRVKEAMRNWSLELQSVADTFRNVFGKEGMAKMFRQMGMYNLDRGFTDSANVLDQIQEKMAEFYKKNTQKYGKSARDQNGILSEGVVGFLIQAVPAKGEQESIAQRRDLIKQDIANRRGDTQQKDKIDMANRIEEILNKIDGNSVEEILTNMKANYRPNHDSLTYLMNDLLPQYKDFLKQFDENFNDQANNYDNPYYLPIAFIRSGPELEITPESESMFYEGMSLRPKQAANTIKRVEYSVLPTDKSGNPKEIQFNLRRGTYDSLSDQINKAYTNEAWQQIFSFMKTAEATDVFGGRANKDFMAERLNRLRISRMRRGSANNGAIAKFADSVSVLARKIGTGIALGGVFQVFKQSPDQLISALGTTGRYDLLGEHVMTVGFAKKLLDKFSIGRRGDASAGYKYINQMEGAQNRLERAFTESRWSEVKENASKIADVWMVALKKTDFLCAAGAWMTYYRANLDKNGIKFEGWDKEAQLVDSDTSRQDAASYAEQMTDIYQGSSDPTKMATFAQSGKSGWENFVKAAIVPFNSFAIQQRMRIYSDGRDSFTRGGDTGMAGRFGLASTIGGLIAFHTMRRLVLPTITGAGVYVLYGMLGIDMDEPDEEKKKAEANKNWRQFQGEILTNILVGGAPQFVEAATIDAFNYANYLISLQLESEDIIDDDGKIMEYAKYQKERSPFWRYQSFKNAPSFGMFDVGMGQAEKVAVQTKQLMDREQMEMYTPEEQRLLYFSTLSEWMYLMRLNDADFARMVGKARRDMMSAAKDREKQIKAIRSGR